MKSVPIKFRGKCIETGAWLYGGYCKMGESTYILPDNRVAEAVFVDSVAQLVGYDANGEEVYEGDKIDTGIATFNVAIHPAASYACHVDISESILVKGKSDE